MATKSKQPWVEEFLFRSDSAFLCLLLNRRTRLIRVIDFRAGALPAKRLFIQSMAKKEGIEKVITLVEKDEVSSWTRVGFVREGTIPGFYKRSDGHVCGCVIGDKTASVEVNEDGQKLAEKTIVQAKKIAKDIPEELRGIKVEQIEDTELEALRDKSFKKGQSINSFDVFGRDAERISFSCASKGATNYLGAEFQDCFGHSLVEVMHRPEDDKQLKNLVGGLRHMCADLKERGIVSAFGFAASDDVQTGAAYVAAGFRKTGLLASGITEGDARKDAILWTQRLANPGEEDL